MRGEGAGEGEAVSETLREPVRGWRVLLAEAEAERDELRAEVDRLLALHREAVVRAEKAEAALRAWRQGEKGYQCAACAILTAVLRDTVPAEQPEAEQP